MNALIVSHVDYCNTVLAGSLRYITDKLQHVLNADSGSLIVACFTCSIPNIVGYFPLCVQYKLGVRSYWCLMDYTMCMCDVCNLLSSAGCTITSSQVCHSGARAI